MSGVTRRLRGGAGGAPGELLFQAHAPPLGFSTFEVKQLSLGGSWDPPRWPSGDPEPWIENEVRGHRGGTWIGGGVSPSSQFNQLGGHWVSWGGVLTCSCPPPHLPQHLRVLFDPITGHLSEIQNLAKGFSLPVFQSFYW